MEYVRRGEVKLLYVAPETLLTPRILSLLDSVQVDCLTIDEAHCISEWGHDFRPEYRQLVEVRKRFPKRGLSGAHRHRHVARSAGYSRYAQVFHRPTNSSPASTARICILKSCPSAMPIPQTIEMLERYKDQSGIIYCFSRKQVDELAAYLASQGLFCPPYHAGLEDPERRRNQEAFIRDDAQIIVATIAFGMGINKPNVRFVIHFDLPKSIEGLLSGNRARRTRRSARALPAALQLFGCRQDKLFH